MPLQSQFGTETTIQDVCRDFAAEIKGKTVLITGPSLNGLGYILAEHLTRSYVGCLILAGRQQSELDQVERQLSEIPSLTKIILVNVDLNSMDSVKQASAQILALGMPIDVLINNAGVMAAPYKVTGDGHDVHFSTNYLGHWLLTQNLLPLILSSQGKRLVNLATSGGYLGELPLRLPMYEEEGYDGMVAYLASKTAVTLFTVEMATRYADKGLTAFSVAPGSVPTPMQRHWPMDERHAKASAWGATTAFHENGDYNRDQGFWKTREHGSATICRAAFDPELAPHSGSYLESCQIDSGKLNPAARDPVKAGELWVWTNMVLGENF